MKIVRIITWGGLGDGLLVTPALRALKVRQQRKIHVFCANRRHLEIFKNNPHIDRLRIWSNWMHPIASLKYWLRPERYIYTSYGAYRPSLTIEKHAAEIIADMLDVRLDSEKPEIFLSPEEDAYGAKTMAQYRLPFVIHTTAHNAKNKSWPLQNWQGLVRDNTDVDFIQIGKPEEKYIPGAVDMRGLSLRETFSLIKWARAFVGVESLFAHVASAVGTRALVLFGSSTPSVWGYPMNTNLYEHVVCSPCIDVLGLDPCPFGTRCMQAISVNRVSREVRLIARQEWEPENCATQVSQDGERRGNNRQEAITEKLADNQREIHQLDELLQQERLKKHSDRKYDLMYLLVQERNARFRILRALEELAQMREPQN